MAYPPLETSRLLLKPIELDDAGAIQQLLPRWEVVRFLYKGIPWPYPPTGAQDFLKHSVLPNIAKGNLWMWSLRTREYPCQLIGIIELYRSSRQNRSFWLAPEWQGHGYMTEAVEAVTAFWFDVLGFERMVTQKAVLNKGSARLSKRTGMRLIGHSHADFLEGDNLETEIWEMTRSEWKKHASMRSG
ncbi:hypothetical protein LMG33818_001351 [Halomonadaceae bacterium LMG 33818]|uniref:GNAT family N-acetyltransferase n=1 Tax=Cernens ardua TaxID=3402176 RepID=UPI003EDBA880